MNLTTEDFEAFHTAVHGRPPFEWQRRLLQQVVANRAWPRVLDLPTGSGKTTCIDIAVFALALDARTPPRERWCPRRIVMVVDRRIVVDQAAERGRKLLRAILGSAQPVLVSVREALGTLVAEGEDPLAVYVLRGGIPKDDSWARTPDQPLVISSTVDQLGSRLLLRGYGVSRSMRPVHAGLASNDVLLLLDEVHLSRPFEQTLSRLTSLRSRFVSNGLPRRFQVASLSATPGEPNEEAFRLTSSETEPSSALGPRLHASKRTALARVSGRTELTARVVNEAKRLLTRHRIIAAVVNRVDTALHVASSLRDELELDVVLLTGRMRPLERDDILAMYRDRVMTGSRTRTEAERKLVVVGTQCVEAGADFDFDALVTESASFDALRQRFGRVDRLGIYRDSDGASLGEGVIVHDASTQDDPVYGDKIHETMKWLGGKADKKTKVVDFGNRSLLDAPFDLAAPKPHAPTLLPAYLDLWTQTSPEPAAVPDTALFLHGVRSGPEDVQVVWRADIDEAALVNSGRHGEVISAIAAIQPSSLEAISLPFFAAKRWLMQQRDALTDVADVEGPTSDDRDTRSSSRPAVLWRGDTTEVIRADQLRPGDTIVVPASYGGIDPDTRCFAPSSPAPVTDLAERAALAGRGRPVLRLHPRVVEGLGLNLDLEDPERAREQLQHEATELRGWKAVWASLVGRGRKQHTVPWEDDSIDPWLVLEADRVSAHVLRETLGEGADAASLEQGPSQTTDDEDSPFSGAAVELATHSVHVETRARGYAERLGFCDEVIDDIALAGWLHDIGKADPRFQRMLRGGSEIAFYRAGGQILAKSEISATSKAERKRAQQISGYPRGARHEVQSLAMLEAQRPWLATKAHDVDLVLHLVASHHGFCRPLAPAVEDRAPVEVELDAHASEVFGTVSFSRTTSAHGLHRFDSAIADRFWGLVERYGWLELCWLEAVMRLADHRASEEEAGGPT